MLPVSTWGIFGAPYTDWCCPYLYYYRRSTLFRHRYPTVLPVPIIVPVEHLIQTLVPFRRYPTPGAPYTDTGTYPCYPYDKGPSGAPYTDTCTLYNRCYPNSPAVGSLSAFSATRTYKYTKGARCTNIGTLSWCWCFGTFLPWHARLMFTFTPSSSRVLALSIQVNSATPTFLKPF